MTKTEQILELRRQIGADQAFDELRQTAIQLVMGEGSLDAEIVCIGEAPGKQEDIRGVPFVGASGRFLDEMFKVAGMNREDVYITNIVKYRPPANRDPSVAEKTAFWLYLSRQLEIINPRVVITLGRHSGLGFIPDLVISRDHGQPRTVHLGEKQLLVIPLYHPAAALYNGSMRQTLTADFQLVASYAKGL